MKSEKKAQNAEFSAKNARSSEHVLPSADVKNPLRQMSKGATGNRQCPFFTLSRPRARASAALFMRYSRWL